MTELGWDDTDVTVVRPTGARVLPPPLPGDESESLTAVPLGVTEVQGDERRTWNFLKATMPVPMIRATQALPLVRLRRRRLIAAMPWIAMVSGAISGVILCWWLTVPKSPPIVHTQAPARVAIRGAVAAVAISGPEHVRVEVDGVAHGTLPLRLEGLLPGRHRIEFDGRPDGGVLVRDVELTGGETTKIDDVTL
jgi:hypothetical protein